MKTRMMILAAMVAVLTACGGGGGGAGGGNIPVAPGGGGSIPTPTPTPAPVTQATGQFTPSSSSSTATLPAVTGYTGTITVPPATSGTAPVTVTTSTTAQAGTVTLTGNLRHPMAASNTPLLYITLTATGNVTFSASPGLTVSVPSTMVGPYYLAQYQGGAWSTVAGPFTSATFPSSANPFSMTAGQSLYFSLYTGGVLATPTPIPTPTPTPTPVPQSVSGKVILIGQGTYGPTAPPVGNDAGATVIVGPTLITGPTAPSTLPAGDVAATTDSSGNFSAAVSAAQIVPPSGTFVIPNTNVLNIVPPAKGYFVMVFSVGTDGKSAGAALPVHTFVGVGTAGALGTFRVTTASSDEAAWLAKANADRAAQVSATSGTWGSATPEYLDENVEEAAREHANWIASNFYGCHYETTFNGVSNVGPVSRYLAMGGIGQDGEGLAGLGTTTITSGGIPGTNNTNAWQGTEKAFVSEGPSGGHYQNLMAPPDIWMGLAVTSQPWSPGGAGGAFFGVDMENANTTYTSAPGYPNTSCPSGITANNS